MNAERLHAIALELLEEIVSMQTRESLTGLVNALETQVNTPTDAGSQQEIADYRTALTNALASAPSNTFSPAWREALAELGLLPLVGAQLLERVDEVFARNQITPSVARDELRPIGAALDAAAGGLDQLVKGMAELGIGAEELEPGEVELGVLIPRWFVNDELEGLAKELDQIRKLLRPMIELATGSAPGIRVKSVSSSDFNIVLDLAPEALTIISGSIAYLIAQYKQVLEIRKLKVEIRRLDMPEALVENVEAEATNRVNEKIGELVEAVLDEHSETLRGDGRDNEVRVDLRHSFEGIALRIDKGFNFDVRARPPELEEGDAEEGATEPTPEEQVQQAMYDRILQAMPELQFMHLEGEPILSLEDPNMDRPSTDE